jgi:hypothetical protein
MCARAFAAAALAAFAAGCASYSWRPSVPPEMRTVSVPVFRNEGAVAALGGEVARQVLRELQREGTFRIARPDDASVEVQGSVKAGDPTVVAYERRTGSRIRERELHATATVSFIDKKGGKTLVDGRKYRARVTFAAGDDVLTGARDASSRLAEELARQIADDLVAWKL